MSFNGSKTRPLWYAAVGRKANKEVVGRIDRAQDAKKEILVELLVDDKLIASTDATHDVQQ